MTTIQIAIRNVYGADRIYPTNDAGCTLARIAGTKTLTLENLTDAKRLGHTVTCISEPSTMAEQACAALGAN
jgi:hypothetical protein